jgi:hypothetical protein
MDGRNAPSFRPKWPTPITRRQGHGRGQPEAVHRLQALKHARRLPQAQARGSFEDIVFVYVAQCSKFTCGAARPKGLLVTAVAQKDSKA